MRYNQRLKIWGFLFVLPAVVFLFLFIGYPMVMSLFLGFTDYRLGTTMPRFVGLANYIKALSSPGFINSLRVSIVYVIGTVVPIWFFSFIIAFSLSKLRRALGVWRTLLFLPTVIPIVTVSIAWKYLFHYDGLVNWFLSCFNISPIPWLTSSSYAPSALIIASWWHGTSYYMILFLSGLLAIPSSYLEAAKIDGATEWQLLRYITLPLLRPTIILVFVISIINGFRTFALQKIVTNGGPATATEITTLHIYKTAFNFGLYNEAAAMSFLYFLMILVFSLIQFKILGGEESGL